MRIRLVILALLAFAVTAAPAQAATAGSDSAGNCIVIVEEGGDMGEQVCFNEPDCLVAYYRTTFIGSDRFCLVPRPGGVATSDVSTDVQLCSPQPRPYGSRFCVETGSTCLVSEYRTSGADYEYRCIVRRP